MMRYKSGFDGRSFYLGNRPNTAVPLPLIAA